MGAWKVARWLAIHLPHRSRSCYCHFLTYALLCSLVCLNISDTLFSGVRLGASVQQNCTITPIWNVIATIQEK